jgi:hypothetical protein
MVQEAKISPKTGDKPRPQQIAIQDESVAE